MEHAHMRNCLGLHLRNWQRWQWCCCWRVRRKRGSCSQVCLLELLEDQVVLALDSLELVAPELLQGHLSLDSPYHPALGTWPTWTRLDPCLATPAVQRSKSGRVTNAKAKIQI